MSLAPQPTVDAGPDRLGAIRVDPRLADMPVDFLTCRELRHSWVHQHKGLIYLTPALRSVTYFCTRCTAICEVVFDIDTFETYSRRYRYPEGYLVPTTDGHGITRREVRAALIARLFSD